MHSFNTHLLSASGEGRDEQDRNSVFTRSLWCKRGDRRINRYVIDVLEEVSAGRENKAGQRTESNGHKGYFRKEKDSLTRHHLS